MDAPARPATVGTEFRSTGSDGKKRTNRDRSVVTEAIRPSVFEFVTDGRCETNEAGKLVSEGTYVHRYELQPTDAGCRVTYAVEITRLTGGPAAILRAPVIGRIFRRSIASWMRRGLDNLRALAQERSGTAAG